MKPSKHHRPADVAVRTETEERIAAHKRAAEKRYPIDPVAPIEPHDPALINKTVAALCENVRDYAIFVLNAQGIIIYWGMGAHLMKWWTKAEAEGAHLRLLYPEGGSEDGTAEEHLAQSAATGEYVGEGQRVRRGGSTFWAHVTLTALYHEGELIGFAKVTKDLTQRRAIEAAVALANEAQTSREAALDTARRAEEARLRAEEARQKAEAARERAEEAAEFARAQARDARKQIEQELQPALRTERAERASLDVELDAYMQLFAQRHRERENDDKG